MGLNTSEKPVESGFLGLAAWFALNSKGMPTHRPRNPLWVPLKPTVISRIRLLTFDVQKLWKSPLAKSIMGAITRASAKRLKFMQTFKALIIKAIPFFQSEFRLVARFGACPILFHGALFSGPGKSPTVHGKSRKLIRQPEKLIQHLQNESLVVEWTQL